MTLLPDGLRDRRLLGAPVADLALALVLAVVGLLETAFDQWQSFDQWAGNPHVNAVVVPLTALTLTWRRRAPLAVLTAVLAGMAALSLGYGASQTSINVFVVAVAVYSAAAYCRSPLLAATLTALGVILRDSHDPKITTFSDHLWSWLFAGLAFAAGMATRYRQAHVSLVEQRSLAQETAHNQRLAEAVQDERSRIARELHDVVSHSLGIVVLQAGAAEQVLEDDPDRVRTVLESIRATGLEAIGEMGTLLNVIHPGADTSREPQPALTDLDLLVAKMRATGVDVNLHVEGRSRSLPAAVELSAFRIVQEGLTNSLKHAPSADVTVILRYCERELQIEVSDNGTGSQSNSGTRRGLTGIGERVAVFGGHLDVGPRAGGGWSLRAALPVEP